MGSPLLWGPNNTASNLQTQILQSNGSLLANNGSKNYISYNNFENAATTGWSLGTVGSLTNGIPTGSPTFGSGASGNLSITTVSSGQIAGNASLSLVSSAATTQGDMLASQAYSLDTSDQAKVLTFQFYYKLQSFSGTQPNFSGTSSNSWGVAVYDVTNSSWLSLAGNFAMTQSSGVGYATGTCQTNATTASIRFVIYNVNATNAAATLYLDRFFLGPQTAPIGAPMTDPVAYTPTFTGLGTVSGVSVYWQRIGKNVYVYGQVVAGSTSGTLTATLPPGLVIDSSYGAAGVWVPSGTVNANAGNGAFTLITMASAGDTVISFGEQAASASSGSQMSGGFFSSGQTIRFNFIAPIAGWSSNVQMSSDTDTRVVAMSVGGAATAAGSNNTINFPTTNFDTNAGYSAGTYTIPVTGYYSANTYLIALAANVIYYIFVNGVQKYAVGDSQGAGSQNVAQGAVIFKANAGDLITVRAISGSPATLGADSFWSMNRLSGPAVVAASETVAASFGGAATGVSSGVAIIFPTSNFDSHNAYSTSTGTYTVPVSGYYTVSGNIQSNQSSRIFHLYVNGSDSQFLSESSSAGAFNVAEGLVTLRANAGDTLTIRPSGGSSATLGSGTSVSIWRIK